MIFLHAFMAMLAVWRMTEIVTLDRISEPLKKRWPSYLWTCQRCVSVWAGAICVMILWLFPWANWPLAFSWAYLAYRDASAIMRRPIRRGVLVEQAEDGVNDIRIFGFSRKDVRELAEQLVKVSEGRT